MGDVEVRRGAEVVNPVVEFGQRNELVDLYFPIELRPAEQYFTMRVRKKLNEDGTDASNSFLSNRTDVQRMVNLQIEGSAALKGHTAGALQKGNTYVSYITFTVATDKTFQTHKKQHDENISLAESRVTLERFNILLNAPLGTVFHHLQSKGYFSSFPSVENLKNELRLWRNELSGMQSEVLQLIESIRTTQLKIKSIKGSAKLAKSSEVKGDESLRSLAAFEKSETEKLSDTYNKTLRPWVFEFYYKGKNEKEKGKGRDAMSKFEVVDLLFKSLQGSQAVQTSLSSKLYPVATTSMPFSHAHAIPGMPGLATIPALSGVQGVPGVSCIPGITSMQGVPALSGGAVGKFQTQVSVGQYPHYPVVSNGPFFSRKEDKGDLQPVHSIDMSGGGYQGQRLGSGSLEVGQKRKLDSIDSGSHYWPAVAHAASVTPGSLNMMEVPPAALLFWRMQRDGLGDIAKPQTQQFTGR
mmetsp:Transcript_7369/g.19118  ORF Transcript_7369/g.19118 Transcript_7369/m.19118 type:complete len:468 (+) Transcript_7369:601-2004(+)